MKQKDKTLIFDLREIVKPVKSMSMYILFIGLLGAVIALFVFEKANNTIKGTSYVIFDHISDDLLKNTMGINLLNEFYKYSENELLQLEMEDVLAECEKCSKFNQFVIFGSNRSNLRFSATMITEDPDIAEYTFKQLFNAVKENFNNKIFDRYTYLLDLDETKQEITEKKRQNLLDIAKVNQNIQLALNLSEMKYTEGEDMRPFLEKYIDFENPTILFKNKNDRIILDILGSGFNFYPLVGFFLSTFISIILIIFFRNYRLN